MQRRKFLIGAGSAAVGASAIVGSGAVSNMVAGRSLTVNVADDSNAYVRFDTDLGSSPDNNYVYAEINENGELEINFDGNSNGGQGVNPNSETYFNDVFKVQNQGTEDLEIWFELSDGLKNHIDLYPIAGNDGQETSLVGESNAYTGPGGMQIGSSGLRIGIMIDTSNLDSGIEELSGTITLHARAI
jgi:hypothetical protein